MDSKVYGVAQFRRIGLLAWLNRQMAAELGAVMMVRDDPEGLDRVSVFKLTSDPDEIAAVLADDEIADQASAFAELVGSIKPTTEQIASA